MKTNRVDGPVNATLVEDVQNNGNLMEFYSLHFP